MRKIVLLLASLLTAPIVADTYVGIGTGILIPGEDIGEKPVSFSFVVEQNREYPWAIGFKYTPNYEVYKVNIEDHASFFVDKRLISWDIGENLNAYLTFGLAAHTRLSIVNSSWVNFSERIGLQYKDVRLELHHTSNAGIFPPNEGETSLSISYRYEW